MKNHDNKNSGFTLVELLAVIAVLAIVSAITVPVVLKTINNSKEKSEKQSIIGYANALENYMKTYMINHPGEKCYDNEDSNSTKCYQEMMEKVSEFYQGNKIVCEEINVLNDGKIELINCYVSYDNITNDQKKELTHYNYSNGNVEINSDDNNTIYKSYSVGNEITLKGAKYYVLKDSPETQNYVTLLKDDFLKTSEITPYLDNTEIINNYSGGSSYFLTVFSSGDVSYENTYNPEYSLSEIKQIINAWSNGVFKNNELKKVVGYKARLINKDEYIDNCEQVYIAAHDTTDAYYRLEPKYSWLAHSSSYSGGWWTMSKEDETKKVYVIGDGHGSTSAAAVSPALTYYVRPVINVYKSKIEN